MTAKQEIVSISVGVATTIMAIVVIIVSTVNRDYMREYVKKSIEVYDSTVTYRNSSQYDTIIDRLDRLNIQLNERENSTIPE